MNKDNLHCESGEDWPKYGRNTAEIGQYEESLDARISHVCQLLGAEAGTIFNGFFDVHNVVENAIRNYQTCVKIETSTLVKHFSRSSDAIYALTRLK